MIRIDIHKRRIKANSAHKQGDQNADRPGVDPPHGNRDRFAIVVVKRGAGSEQEAGEVIARRHAGFHFDGHAPRFQNAHKRHEEVVHSVAQLLHVGMLVG